MLSSGAASGSLVGESPLKVANDSMPCLLLFNINAESKGQAAF